MKKDRHPAYRDVLFVDSSNGFKFICGSTVQSKENEVFEGKEYPVVRLPITSASHPFFTGSNKFVDTEGRVEKFMNRYEQAKKRTAQLATQNEETKRAVLTTTPKVVKATRKV
jgi:large subunit ribosomal protein L31